jgi:serine/threonine protein kinase
LNRAEVEILKQSQEQRDIGEMDAMGVILEEDEETSEETSEKQSYPSIQEGGQKNNQHKRIHKMMTRVRQWLRGDEDSIVPSGWGQVMSMAENEELQELGRGHYGRIYLVCVDMETSEIVSKEDAVIRMKEQRRSNETHRENGDNGYKPENKYICFALKQTRQAYQGDIKKSAEVDIVDAIIAYRDTHNEPMDTHNPINGILHFADTRRDAENRRDYIAMEIVSKSMSHLLKRDISIYGADAEQALKQDWNQWMTQLGKILDLLHHKMGIYHLDVNMNNIMLRRRNIATDLENEDGEKEEGEKEEKETLSTKIEEYELVLGDFGHAEFKTRLMNSAIWGTEGRRMIETDEDRMLLKSLTKNENADKWVLFDTFSLSEVEQFLERKGKLAEIWIEMEADGLDKKNTPRMEYKERLFRKIWNEGLYEEILRKHNKINYLGFIKTWGAEGIEML